MSEDEEGDDDDDDEDNKEKYNKGEDGYKDKEVNFNTLLINVSPQRIITIAFPSFQIL